MGEWCGDLLWFVVECVVEGGDLDGLGVYGIFVGLRWVFCVW